MPNTSEPGKSRRGQSELKEKQYEKVYCSRINHIQHRNSGLAAGGKDVLICGGADTVRKYLKAKLIDEMRLAISSMILGSAEPLFGGVNLIELGYGCVESTLTERAMHVVPARNR